MESASGPRLYTCLSLRSRDSADVPHVLSVGIDLAPALAAQGFDAQSCVAEIAAACRREGGAAAVPAGPAARIRDVAHVLNIAWVEEALPAGATLICPRSSACPRTPRCAGR
jgi:hypothetical protein